MFRHYCYLFVLLTACPGVFGQNEITCRDKLDRMNRLPQFPETKTVEYKTCLDAVESYFYSIDQAVQKNNQRAETLKSALLKSKNNLSSGSATKKDSADYKALDTSTAKEIKGLTDSNKALVAQKDKYKVSLKDSFNKIIDLFHNTNNPDEAVYRAKLAKLNTPR